MARPVVLLALASALLLGTHRTAEAAGDQAPAVTVRAAPDGCAPAAFVAELRALGLEVGVADRDDGAAPGVGVALQRGADGVRLILWLDPAEPPERLAVGSATCDDAALMGALIVNRRLRGESLPAEPAPELSLRPLTQADRAPLAVERAADASPAGAPLPSGVAAAEGAPVPGSPSTRRWGARLDLLSGVELALADGAPDVAGLEVRGVVLPGDDVVLLSAGLGFDGAFGWPSSRARVTAYVIDAWARAGARFRVAWAELEPTLGLGLSHHLVKLEDGGAGFEGHPLPKLELALGAGLAHPLSVRLDLGVLWSPWSLHVLAPSRALDATIGGLTFRARLGFGIDFF